MKNLQTIAVAVLIALVAVGCCNCRKGSKQPQRPLAGSSWQLIQLGEKTVNPAPESYTITFSAEGGGLTGVGDCNRLMGSFEEDAKGMLSISSLASTRMLCPEGSLEGDFIAALEAVTHYDYDLNGSMLLLLSNGELRAVLQRIGK